MPLQVGEVAMGECRFMRGAQHDARRLSGIERLLPAGRAKTPPVAGLEPRKLIVGVRRREIVAARLAEGEEVGGHDGADRVRAEIGGRGVAAAIAEKAGERRIRAGLQEPAEHVPSRAAAAPSGYVEWHGTVLAVFRAGRQRPVVRALDSLYTDWYIQNLSRASRSDAR